VARREVRKARQPPFILLDHNVQAGVAAELVRLARFRQIGETEREERFRRDARDPEIHTGKRNFLFVTHDRDFLAPGRLPTAHGGVLVFVCPPSRLAEALRRFLEWWGPRRELLRNRVFRLSARGGAELLRDGSVRRVFRQPAESSDRAYGSGDFGRVH
jgi:hypothetical protein